MKDIDVYAMYAFLLSVVLSEEEAQTEVFGEEP